MAATNLLVVLQALCMLYTVSGSYLTGSKFPFEGCKLQPGYNRWTSELLSYDENAETGSRVCFLFGVKPADQCTPSGLRCCTAPVFNKFKMYVEKNCTRSIINIVWRGKPTSAIYYENTAFGGYIAKITPLSTPLDQLDQSILCFTLRGKKSGGTCSTLNELSNSNVRGQGVLEYAMYDKKNVYECCPVFTASTDPTGNPAPPRAPTAKNPDVPQFPQDPFAPSFPPPSPPPPTSKASPPPPRPPPPSPPPPPGPVSSSSPPPPRPPPPSPPPPSPSPPPTAPPSPPRSRAPPPKHKRSPPPKHRRKQPPPR